MTQHVVKRITDPRLIGWPETLPIEVALHTQPIEDLCNAYGLSVGDWNALVKHPGFQAEVAAATEMLKDEGMNFKVRAKLQALALLNDSWSIIHDGSGDVPATVKADLIKSTVKWAGWEGKETGGADAPGTALQINIHFSGEKK